MSKILVTGGCGYIGSHTLVDLIDNGFDVISIDNLINSSADILEGVKSITGKTVQNYPVDLCDKAATQTVFRAHPDIAGVIHFAALKYVGESVEKPLLYFRNNLDSLLNVLECMVEFGVKNIIFSSSCSVYGNATELPVTESTPFQTAESPYARTKQMGEQILEDVCFQEKELNAVILRYFNPGGAHESTLIGEAATAATNLVPVITETAAGKRASMTVFGSDYPTRDGSCVRDYIHVMDLANAHTKAIEYLLAERQEKNCEVYNLGIGEGVTVLEAIHAFEAVSGVKLNYQIGPRRAGDVVAIYANNNLATSRLGWSAKRGITDIMRTAWAWQQKRK
ncbi:MAG TPA: UDP-glucose 4-epimerase GalE [Haliscomenobacter sp.]|uniref:UDP-glucose 4-epimerase GalE n=1 Tax=Haliscomenobacter sp. TaxID=2717303 RepID=UPI002BE2654F|nr:UDP-glucose 4-epimerase GalE [Haliscomenobacter sp.]HOY20806.1 UDP-glucose 4-epimerase GalE [Haliscomenobacter sp.]HPH20934.1 UDP-glucose 4-epimerase GalE [Haliscomenobacter sp.]